MKMLRAIVAQARPRQSCHWCVHARRCGGHWRPSCHALWRYGSRPLPGGSWDGGGDGDGACSARERSKTRHA